MSLNLSSKFSCGNPLHSYGMTLSLPVDLWVSSRLKGWISTGGRGYPPCFSTYRPIDFFCRRHPQPYARHHGEIASQRRAATSPVPYAWFFHAVHYEPISTFSPTIALIRSTTTSTACSTSGDICWVNSLISLTSMSRIRNSGGISSGKQT